MKKVMAILCVIVLCGALVTACGQASVSPDGSMPSDVSVPADNSKVEIHDHQELTATEITIDTDTALRVSLPEAGLYNLHVVEVSDYGRLDGDDGGYVYLLGDDRGRGRFMMDHYLAVQIGDTAVLKDLMAYEQHFNHEGYMELGDVDGDGDSEIIVQECVANIGGFGNWLSRVFNFADGEIVEMFTSDLLIKETGFAITLLKDKQFRIDNTITGYSEIFRLEDRNEDYFKWWYDENGEPYQKDFMVDSFYEFLPTDVDGDRVYEIACRQYVSLIGHSDGIGCAKTVLKYNSDTAAFEIIDASFELFDE